MIRTRYAFGGRTPLPPIIESLSVIRETCTRTCVESTPLSWRVDIGSTRDVLATLYSTGISYHGHHCGHNEAAASLHRHCFLPQPQTPVSAHQCAPNALHDRRRHRPPPRVVSGCRSSFRLSPSLINPPPPTAAQNHNVSERLRL